MTAEVQTLAIPQQAFIIFVAEGLERFVEKESDASPEPPRPGLAGTRPRDAGRTRRRRSNCEHDHL